MNTPSLAKTFFILQVYDGRGTYGFGLGLTDQALASDMLDAFGRDLLGRKIELVSLDMVPEGFGSFVKHAAHTSRIKLLMERCATEPVPGRAFLVAYVAYFKTAMPLSQVASMLEHAKYEPDHEQFAYIPLHQTAIGRAYP
ncbi:hypothetical protein QN382_12495 [Pseudomonas sp. 10B1]|uniref:hypothetical protein n=1 Tax=unclassified Pseudomonas TaxID=196821 RepID=UPI002B230DBD|nr:MULTISPECIES: hypothetical protein [unclassified Pseudomonas]MEA9996304.1 hypothetical protein [Pseudomonas sp. AA4]MEB0086654.1 hypothetical protein [Pseudomonas sp. RTI1]MEB0124704.1 hypothetical protein [Pseudomonas sp. CCC1.2]MEB0154968.1 hypothetical protein [Pseudomonas sp. CCC4.3]MEB0217923.1 hypothetical protein [Pseudomonas sp. AB12(2023)]